MRQPIKKEIVDKHGIEDISTPKYILYIDGTNLLKVSMVDKAININGLNIGAILQFFIQLKILLNKRNFSRCYVFWDGELSGILKYNHYSDYKKSRDKVYSEYDQHIKAYSQRILQHSKKNEKQLEKEREKKLFQETKLIIQVMLEELFICQYEDEGGTESDDLIAYAILSDLGNYHYIWSTDSDLEQLLDYDNVCIYNSRLKKFLHKGNYQENRGIHVSNVCLLKTMVGETSDNIKGIKGLGRDTLIKLFPDIRKKPITTDHVIENAKLINENRINNKQKPLKVCENIINRVTDGLQGEEVLNINEKIINLKNPMLTNEARAEMDNIIHNPIDPDGRSMENLYRIINDNKIYDLMNNKFSSFFVTFKRLVNNELKFYEKHNNYLN